MSGGRKKSGFLITSVTSDCGASPGAGGPGSQPPVDGHQGGAAAPSSPPDPSRGPEERGPPDGSGSPPASRFRVVRLRRALGQPYRRGRWTCVDVLDREARLLAGLRHAHSLDSLDSLESLGGAAGLGATPLPHPFRPLRPGHLVHSQGTTHLLASSVAAGDTAPRQPLSGPPSPRLGPAAAGTPRHRRLPPPLRMDAPPGQALSRPGSPGDASPPRVPCPSQSPSRLALAQSVFGVGGAFQLDEDSGSSNSMIAIDNKIEQAMDLVKTHLMFAVREEVEVLREKIRELSDRNAHLERENELLRTLTHCDQDSQAVPAGEDGH